MTPAETNKALVRVSVRLGQLVKSGRFNERQLERLIDMLRVSYSAARAMQATGGIIGAPRRTLWARIKAAMKAFRMAWVVG